MPITIGQGGPPFKPEPNPPWLSAVPSDTEQSVYLSAVECTSYDFPPAWYSFECLDSGLNVLTTSTWSETNSYTFTGLTSTTTYNFRFRTINNNVHDVFVASGAEAIVGQESDYSEVTTVVLPRKTSCETEKISTWTW